MRSAALAAEALRVLMAETSRRIDEVDAGKLEAQLALEALAHRFPGMRLIPGQQLTFHPNISFRGPQQLWAHAR